MSEKDKAIFGLNKLPMPAYVKALKDRISVLEVQAGKDNSYIIELEEVNKTLLELTPDERTSLKGDVVIRQLRKDNRQLREANRVYHRDQKKFIQKNIELKQKLEDGAK